ncbi:hypothetical protein JCM10207_006234 [Rhodosporidiobolus poonsookiae]
MRAALLLIDIQHDFLPLSGALAVPSGDSILRAAVYPLLDSGPEEGWAVVVASQVRSLLYLTCTPPGKLTKEEEQDAHPPSHISFASRHSLPAFSSTRVDLPAQLGGGGKEQELWPDHCVRGTRGWELDEGVGERLERLRAEGARVEVVRKGEHPNLDAYSAFAVPLPLDPSSPAHSESPLARLLLASVQNRTNAPSQRADAQIDTLVVCGLATDFCVRASVLDALALSQKKGWDILVVREGVRGVDPDQEEHVLRELEEAGARVVSVEGEELKRFLRRRGKGAQ